MLLRIAALVDVTAAEGPYDRFALWVQGCSLRCPGCCNPEMFRLDGGESADVSDLLARIERARKAHGIEGITVLGGEPLEQLSAVTRLCHGARALGLGVLLFTGLRLDQARTRPGFGELWRSLDTMVDGPYAANTPEPAGGRRYVGSTNQRILHRTLRYAAASLWRGPRRAEVYIDSDGRLTLTGFPDPVRRLRAANPSRT